MTNEKKWGDASKLAKIKNPTKEHYEIKIHCPEVTFIGAYEQPDFGCIDITMVPWGDLIELKSLKEYLYTFRDVHISYERFVNVVYDDILKTYTPSSLVVEVEFRPRGGISSKLKVDSGIRVSQRSKYA